MSNIVNYEFVYKLELSKLSNKLNYENPQFFILHSFDRVYRLKCPGQTV